MRKCLIIILSLIGAFSIFLTIKSYNSKKVILDDVKLKEELKADNNAFALWIQQANGQYTESQSNAFPTTGYVFNKSKSGCMDENGNLINNALSYESDKVMVSISKTSYCYVYFDIDTGSANKLVKLAMTDGDDSIYKYVGKVSDTYQNAGTGVDASNVYIFNSEDASNIIFNNYCWKIFRTTESGGIKILYNGTPTDGTCLAENATAMLPTEVAYAPARTSPAYVGYMYNATTGSLNDMLYASNVNTTDSLFKQAIENWFENSGIDSTKLEDAVYCNDRRLDPNETNPTLTETITNQTVYFYNWGRVTSLECGSNLDAFSYSNPNAKLNYKVGFITQAEAFLASEATVFGFTSYYWLGSPNRYDGSKAYNKAVGSGKIGNAIVDRNSGVRPVVTLSSSVSITGGPGTKLKPWIAN